MLKQNYVGLVDFHGVKWARIGGADLSKMTGVTGVDILVLENVTGLCGNLDFRGIKNSLVIKNSDISKVRIIYCNTNFKTDDLKKQNWNGLFIFDYLGPKKTNSKLISDWIQNGKQM